MNTALNTLTKNRSRVERQYRRRMAAPCPVDDSVQIPSDADEAYRAGMQHGRRAGYADGMVDGVELGLDVASSTMDALFRQPVFVCLRADIVPSL